MCNISFGECFSWKNALVEYFKDVEITHRFNGGDFFSYECGS